MTWELFYLICFGVGLALTVVSLVSGRFPSSPALRLHRLGQVPRPPVATMEFLW